MRQRTGDALFIRSSSYEPCGKESFTKCYQSCHTLQFQRLVELKRQIFEGGFQRYYPVQSDFDFPAQRAVERLPDETKALLINEWKSASPPRAQHSDSKILEAYARIIVEEVVERARLAAYRTINW